MKKLNFDIIMKILILLCFSAFYLKIIVTNEITLYVHPRIIPFSVFGVIVMIIIAVFLFTSSLKAETRKFRFKRYIAFIIPLIMIALYQTLKYTSSIKKQDIGANSSSMASNDIQDINRNSNNQTSSSTFSDTYKTDLYGSKTESDRNGTISQNKLDISNGIIKINSKNFVLSLDEIIGNLSKYDGMRIEITGFIYEDPSLNLEENQFIIARYMMVCCAADMQIAGLRCQYRTSDLYDTNTWVTIKGKIKNDVYEGQPDPLILIDEIYRDDNPDTSYVYPY